MSWVASLSMLGAGCGALIGDWIMRRGRKLALQLTSLPLAAAWILTGFAPCIELVFVTSFIGGLCSALITMVAQVNILLLLIDSSKSLTIYNAFFFFSINFRFIYQKFHCLGYAVVYLGC